jgi:hypothetical protein
MKDKKQRRCLKFTVYVFVPNETDNYNDLRYYASRTPGRLKIFDSDNENKQIGKDIAFDNFGQMFNVIERARRKLVYKRVKRK